MKIELDVTAITVLKVKDQMDQIFIHFVGPSPFPKWISRSPILSISTSEGIGCDYVREVFGMEPEVIGKSA